MQRLRLKQQTQARFPIKMLKQSEQKIKPNCGERFGSWCRTATIVYLTRWKLHILSPFSAARQAESCKYQYLRSLN